MSRRTLLPVTALALAAVAGGATWAVAGGASGPGASETASDPGATSTATVERRNLVQRESLDGTLTYADSEPLYAQGAGTVTRLPRPGSVVRRGQVLYWVDRKPVTLMYAKAPMHRRLDAAAADGGDIRALERNLVALGHDPDHDVEIDGEWDWATTAAVKRWQEDRRLEETGAVELGQIVFLPGPRRVGQVATTVGALLQPGAEVMDTSSTRRVVTVYLDADQRSLVHERARVAVELPDGGSVGGRIASVGAVAESEEDPETGEESDPTIPVEIRLPRRAKVGGLDEAPVDVAIARDRAKDVLTVPVSALLALAEGGFAVEVVGADGSRRLVRVEPGIYADGIVEISGAGIEEGMKVAVPE